MEDLFNFTQFLLKFREIKRIVYVDESKQENDIEHSYMLAMLAWYIVSTKKLNLDVDKVIKYALAHDLVETYAGDTYFYHNSKDAASEKQLKEKEAS